MLINAQEDSIIQAIVSAQNALLAVIFAISGLFVVNVRLDLHYTKVSAINLAEKTKSLLMDIACLKTKSTHIKKVI